MKATSMAIADVVVSLVLTLKWKQILVINDNQPVIIQVLNRLSEEGILSAIVDRDTVLCGCYPWPQRDALVRRFDGFLLFAASAEVNNTYDQFSSIITYLKNPSTNIIHSRNRWIMVFDFPLDTRCLSKMFEEADEILLVNPREENITYFDCEFTEIKTVSRIYENIVLDIWSLISPGDLRIYFQTVGNWTAESGLQISSKLFSTPFKNFHARVLRISSLGSPPVTEPPLPGNPKWRGYMFRIINILGDLLNFTYTVKEADNRLYGMEQKDGSWSGMIGELTREEVDVAVGDLSWSPDRSLVVDFTKEVFPEAVTFIYKAPGFYSRAWILFESISSGIWISLFLTGLLAGSAFFMILLCEGIPQKGSQNNRKEKKISLTNHNCQKTAFFTIGTFYRALVNQGCPTLPRGGFSRWVLGIWFIGCMVMGALYSGTLTSCLSTHRSPRPANAIRQLLKWHPDAKLAVRNNSLPHAFFEDSEEIWKEVWENNMKDNIIPAKLHADEALSLVRDSSANPPYVWVAERSMLERRMRVSSLNPAVCDLYVAQEEIIRSDWALALVKNSPYLRQFNDKIRRMQYLGLIDKWRQQHWALENATCQPTDGLNTAGQNTPISLGDTLSLFLLLAMGHTAGLMALIGEFITWHFIAKKQNRPKNKNE